MNEAYFLSHNGLGDNLYSIGAVNCLTQFYDKVYFLCKEQYYDNCVSFVQDNPKIKCVNIGRNDEFQNAIGIIHPHYSNPNVDIFICGCHKQYLKSKITNVKYLKFTDELAKTPVKYNLTHDTITDENYSFIDGFYKDALLNINVFYDYWSLPETNSSTKLYRSVKHYSKIIFIQNKCSDGRELNIKKLVRENLNNDTIMLCNDENVYTYMKHYEQHEKIAQQFVKNSKSTLLNYITTIKNANEIYIIDSCFVGIVLPLLKTSQLKATKVRIILRSLSNAIEL
jgi:hypothetical protein